MSQDAEHLKILSVFHFVVAGLAGLFALFPIIHLIIGIALVAGDLGAPSDEAGTALVGWFFIFFSVCWIGLGLVFAVCLALAGRYLNSRTHYTFCLVMAAIACAFMPFGTVLGVFTILVLMKESVKESFGRAAESAGSA